MEVTKSIVSCWPLHITKSSGSVISALGLTVIVIKKSSPIQSPDVGVTLYIKSWGVLDVFTNTEPGIVLPDPDSPPVISDDELASTSHSYVVSDGTILPVIVFGSTDENEESSQIVSNTLLICGSGFTVMVTINGVPEQSPDLGITVYVSVAAEFAVFDKD